MARKEALKGAETEDQAPRRQPPPQLLDGDVGNPVQLRQERLCASMRPERRSPPSALGRASPCLRARARQRLTLAALTPNRSPTCRWLAPAATAANTRSLKSSDNALDMPTSLLAQQA